MKQVAFLLLFLITFSSAQDKPNKTIWENKNIWIKTYANNRNYNIIINNIVKIEQKIKKTRKTDPLLPELRTRLEIQKSKLELYERNKSFDRLLLPYRYEVPEITVYDYLFETSKKKLNLKIEEYILLKNQFYLATSILKNYAKSDTSKKKLVLESDILYFEEYTENIDKTYLNLVEAKDELNLRYKLYNKEKLEKHIVL